MVHRVCNIQLNNSMTLHCLTSDTSVTLCSTAGMGKRDLFVDGIRQVAGVIAIDPNTQRILLITSRRKENTWVFPKGGWENHETAENAALREAWEEAGIKGSIVTHLGDFLEVKEKKNGAEKSNHKMYIMNVSQISNEWPEMDRERRWVSKQELLSCLNRDFLKQMVHQFLSFHS